MKKYVKKVMELANKFGEFAKMMRSKNKSVAFPSVKIGDQTWMSENLAIDDGGEGIYYNHNNKEYYYTWDAAVRIAGAIPGWHLPTCEEWNTVLEVCGAGCISGGHMGDSCGRDYIGGNLKKQLKVKLVGIYNKCPRLASCYAIFWTATESSEKGLDALLGATNVNGNDYAYRQSFNANRLSECDTISKDSHYTVRLVKD